MLTEKYHEAYASKGPYLAFESTIKIKQKLHFRMFV